MVVGAIIGAIIFGGAGFVRARSIEGNQKWIIIGMLTVMGFAIGAGVSSQIYILSS